MGDWDVVVFSGDLTQMANPEEYSKLSEFLEKLWKLFRELGCNPVLMPVPGNHDLQRPNSLNPAAKAIKNWWGDADLQNAFWEKQPLDYWDCIQSAFLNYVNWNSSVNVAPAAISCIGLLPGDFSIRLRIRDKIIGIVGLNSAWLQISGGDYFKKLHVDKKQLMTVTSNNPDQWCSENDANFLVTHHPTSWLHQSSLREWKSDIDTNNRFDAHLFGHMHDPDTQSSAVGGSRAKNSVQAASLFGLENYGESKEERIHGYSGIKIIFGNDSNIILWPRIATKLKNGAWKVVPDHNFDLEDDESFPIDGIKNDSILDEIKENFNHPQLFKFSSTNELDLFRRKLPFAGSHIHVRTIEQESAISTLKNQRAFWLVSDWGCGDLEFIRTVQQRALPNIDIFEIDCQSYKSRDELLSGIKQQYGISFERFCDMLSEISESLLIFKEVQVSIIQNELDSMIPALLEFCKNTSVILQTRIDPVKSDARIIRLSPLDEADTVTYLNNHDHAVNFKLSTQQVAQIFHYTDGIPSRIDSVLSDASIIGMRQLHTLNSDVVSTHVPVVNTPVGLVSAVSELSSSSDSTLKKAFELLKVLSLFPKGERLEMVKRLSSKSSYQLSDVHILKDRSLIEVFETTSFLNHDNTNEGAILTIKRPVREYLKTLMLKSEIKLLNKKVLAAYFGSNWQLKGIKSSRGPKFSRRNCDAWQLSNANILILRFTKEALESKLLSKIKDAISLATSFNAELIAGDHYNNIAACSSEIIPLFESYQLEDSELVLIRVQRARALRMTGETRLSRDAFLKIDDPKIPKAIRLNILLGLAIAHQVLGEDEDALLAAKECAKLDPRSNSALQARSIVAKCDPNMINQEAELLKIEKIARSRKAFVVANNIALDRAIKNKNTDEFKSLTNNIYQQAKVDGDYHNAMRAVLRYAEATAKSGEQLDVEVIKVIFETYKYLYGESFMPLFNSCHDILWKYFIEHQQIDNLLRLFRLSSITWRFRGNEVKEMDYLPDLKDILKLGISETLKHSQAAAYFFARSSISKI